MGRGQTPATSPMPSSSLSVDMHFRLQKALLLSLVLLATIAWPGTASAQLTCPLTLARNAIAVNKPPPGWQERITGTLRLTSAGMLHGPIDGSGYLKPHSTTVHKKSRGRVLISKWDFGPPPHFEKWLVCEYGSAVETYMPVSAGATSCKITTAIGDGIVNDIEIACSTDRNPPASR